MKVILCEELERLGNGLDLAAVEAWLAGRAPGVEVRSAPPPCDRPERWLGRRLKGADRLILGLCSINGEKREFQAQAMKAGLDPFAVGVVNLGAFCALAYPRPQATEKAKLLLEAALARAHAYPGSRPENAKPVFSWERQVSRRSLFTLPPVRYEAVPSIREDACVAGRRCRVCAKACPHGALSPSADGRMVLNKAQCTGCGACVSLCPRAAIDFPGASLPEIEAQISMLLDAAPLALHPRAIVFLCEGGVAAFEGLAREGLSYPAGWLPVEVPCLGMVTPAWFLQCLNRGAAAVAALPCPPEKCRYGRREVIEGRVDYCRELLRAMGGEPDSVRLLDPADPAGLARDLASLPGLEAREGAPRSQAVFSLAVRGTAEAVLGVAERYGLPLDGSLPHPHSPLGYIEITEGCTGCGACVSTCPAEAIVLERDGNEVSLSFDARRCIGCRECVPVCPEAVVQVEQATDLRRLSQGKRTLYRGSEVRCEACGGPIAPREMIEKLRALLGDHPAVSTITRYCLSCRGTVFH